MTASLAVAILALLAATVLGACQSTQDKSDAIAEARGPLRAEKGLEIKQESSDVKVLASHVLSDSDGAAVVVELRNDSREDLSDVPIAIDVRDAKGKTIYSNDTPGIEPSLAAVPFIRAGETTTWLNDQIYVPGKPDSVEVKVGESETTVQGEIPEYKISSPKLARDPVSGTAAKGVAINQTDELQEELLIYVIARKGEEVVAAGSGALEELKPRRRVYYTAFFVGDPEGADLELVSYPILNPA